MKPFGEVIFVLHAHLPYVHHPNDRHALEHRWLFEALTESYLPLIEVFQELLADQVNFRVTLSVSPTLIAMLTDPWLQSQYEQYVLSLIELSVKEQQRVVDEPDLLAMAQYYEKKLTSLLLLYRHYDRNVLTAWRELSDAGCLELITCGATHAFLPFVLTKEAIRVQMDTALRSHRDAFGKMPNGFWLPECGYTQEVDEVLKESNIAYTFVGLSAFAGAQPPSPFGTFSPMITPHGIAAFTGDPSLATQVWSSIKGYPGDPDYREFYRDLGFDAQASYIAPYIHPEGIRVATGIKYYRVTGPGDYKEPYRLDRAADKVKIHAKHFATLCREQVLAAHQDIGRTAAITLAFDAELFGHWWYEGPTWLGQVLRLLSLDEQVETATPSDYLVKYQDYPVGNLPMSSWGRNGFGEVWMNETNDWIYPTLHAMEQRMIKLADYLFDSSITMVKVRTVKQACRELMLAQASDWSFMMDGRDNAPYAIQRVKWHAHAFTLLYDMIQAGSIDEEVLQRLEDEDAIFKDIDVTLFSSQQRVQNKAEPSVSPILRILMLSWEYPPMMVGGLSRHVYDLSRYLVKEGCEVHVVTTFSGQAPEFEIVEGVYVHRVQVLKPDGNEFIHWTLGLNLAILKKVDELIDQKGYQFDLVHAHDWLVGYAAKSIKQHYALPLVATIHATEYGRNGGIVTDLQKKISTIEWELTYDAQHVIVCSTAMKQELIDIFSLPKDKQAVIANGVDKTALQTSSSVRSKHINDTGTQYEQILVFVGRLVREKGVHILLEAMPQVLQESPHTKLVIMGKGPMLEEWKNLSVSLGISDRVVFTGFISDEERNDWLFRASAAVFPSLYEPFGIVALEAMAMHLPVVVSDIGGLADVVRHQENGLKAIAGNPSSLAQQITYLLQHPDVATSYADQAYEELKLYDWGVIAQQTIGIYHSVLA